MGFIGKIIHSALSPVAGLMDKLGPFQYILPMLPIPGLQPFLALAGAANGVAHIGRGLTTDPPNWSDVINGTMALVSAGAFGAAKAAITETTTGAKYAAAVKSKVAGS